MDSWLKCYILKSIKMKKHMYKNIKVFFATLLLIVAIPSCTNLDEKYIVILVETTSIRTK